MSFIKRQTLAALRRRRLVDTVASAVSEASHPFLFSAVSPDVLERMERRLGARISALLERDARVECHYDAVTRTVNLSVAIYDPAVDFEFTIEP